MIKHFKDMSVRTKVLMLVFLLVILSAGIFLGYAQYKGKLSFSADTISSYRQYRLNLEGGKILGKMWTVTNNIGQIISRPSPEDYVYAVSDFSGDYNAVSDVRYISYPPVAKQPIWFKLADINARALPDNAVDIKIVAYPQYKTAIHRPVMLGYNSTCSSATDTTQTKCFENVLSDGTGYTDTSGNVVKWTPAILNGISISSSKLFIGIQPSSEVIQLGAFDIKITYQEAAPTTGTVKGVIRTNPNGQEGDIATLGRAANVAVKLFNADQSDMSTDFNSQTLTNSQGEFIFENKAPGRYVLVVDPISSGGSCMALPRKYAVGVTISAGSVFNFENRSNQSDLVLNPGKIVRGKAINEAGAVVQDAEITLSGIGLNFPVTDSLGQYQICLPKEIVDNLTTTNNFFIVNLFKEERWGTFDLNRSNWDTEFVTTMRPIYAPAE